jgi:arylsulfatase A-like enzyme
VLGRLAALGLTDQTLVLFLSDNGGRTAITTSGNGPLRGGKGQMWEGGIRVPFLMQWPGRLPTGATYRLPVSSLDVVPTALAAAGAALSPDGQLDGVDLLPFLRGDVASRPHETLYWRMGDKHAIRSGDWKLTVESGAAPALFDLSSDLGEQRDLAASQPEKLQELTRRFEAWSREVGAPEQANAAASNADRRFLQLDANHDGSLTPQELPRPPIFVQMDADADGAVSLAEAKAFWAAHK